MSKHRPEKTYLSDLKHNQQQFEQEYDYSTPDQLIDVQEEEESPIISKSFENGDYTYEQTRHTQVHYRIQFTEKRRQSPENSNSEDQIKERTNSGSNFNNSKSTQLKENKTTSSNNKKRKRTRPAILHSRLPLNQVKQYFS